MFVGKNRATSRVTDTTATKKTCSENVILMDVTSFSGKTCQLRDKPQSRKFSYWHPLSCWAREYGRTGEAGDNFKLARFSIASFFYYLKMLIIFWVKKTKKLNVLCFLTIIVCVFFSFWWVRFLCSLFFIFSSILSSFIFSSILSYLHFFWPLHPSSFYHLILSLLNSFYSSSFADSYLLYFLLFGLSF